jgi:hypothetical protein
MNETKTIEEWAAQKSTEAWRLAVCRATLPGWGVGKVVDEETFDAAMVAAGEHQILQG